MPSMLGGGEVIAQALVSGTAIGTGDGVDVVVFCVVVVDVSVGGVEVFCVVVVVGVPVACGDVKSAFKLKPRSTVSTKITATITRRSIIASAIFCSFA